MGSPMANIFMCHLEKKAMASYRGLLPLFYKRYVDDTMLIFSERDEMLEFHTWLNSQHPSIKFTMEEEVDNQLPFLDVLITRLALDNITTSIYWKPTFSGLYMKWDSFLPKSYKKGLVNCLVFRAWKICSSFELFHKEMEYLKSILAANGYPGNFVDSVIGRFLDKQYSPPSPPVFGPEKKTVLLCLPFSGEQAACKITRQLQRLLAKIAPFAKLRIIFTASQKLSCLSKLKSAFCLLGHSGVVYKISCLDCSAFYIGKTKRRLQQRVQEHSVQDYSAVRRHSLDCSHTINYQNPEILAMDNCDFRLTIKEAIKIKELSAHRSLNANISSVELKLF